MSNAYGIGIITIIVAVSISAVYYQNFYLPESLAKPSVPHEILEPAETTEIIIEYGAMLEEQEEDYTPDHVVVTLGTNNRVVWINEDETGHTVTADNHEVDKYSGRIESNGIIMPGDTFEFIFTDPIELKYHCTPHPWMQASLKVERSRGI